MAIRRRGKRKRINYRQRTGNQSSPAERKQSKKTNEKGGRGTEGEKEVRKRGRPALSERLERQGAGEVQIRSQKYSKGREAKKNKTS